MSTVNRPPIGALAMLKQGAQDVHKICAIRGYTIVTAGVLVAPSAKVTLQNLRTQERSELLLSEFFRDYRWEIVS